ncbi:MAG: peptide-methionine (S)-S-oxide reductase MsrA [Sphingomonadaceae bacterium]|nr:peptide-methionine (S)-S-oxide reductase MsrA [Sphingomonadaceae bacterium]
MKTLILSAVAAAAVVAAFVSHASGAAEAMRVVRAPALELPAATAPGVAVFAGGCFWGLEGVFEHVAGVKSVTSGYAGGAAATAHYEIVGTGLTGHAEAVRIVYDPAKISFGTLLRVYFSVATDPTQLNHQEPDDGTQYRGTVFAQSPAQAEVTTKYIAQLNAAKTFAQPVLTTVESGKPFYAAEGYHQNFLARNPTYPYIVYNDLPKVTALKRLFPALYREKPTA